MWLVRTGVDPDTRVRGLPVPTLYAGFATSRKAKSLSLWGLRELIAHGQFEIKAYKEAHVELEQSKLAPFFVSTLIWAAHSPKGLVDPKPSCSVQNDIYHDVAKKPTSYQTAQCFPITPKTRVPQTTTR